MQAFIQSPEDHGALARGVRDQGYAFLATRLSPAACRHVMDFVDTFPEARAEINYGGTEKRIWDAQTGDAVVQAFAQLSDEVMAAVFRANPRVKTVLAYSNRPIPPQDRLMTGRWHLDSLRNQYKLFCFLTKTAESTGPLELVPGTHKTRFKLGPMLGGRYIAPTDLRTGRRQYQRLDDGWVASQCARLGPSKPMLCEAGALILVDTSAIHRARPCLDGHRYALCAYYDHF